MDFNRGLLDFWEVKKEPREEIIGADLGNRWRAKSAEKLATEYRQNTIPSYFRSLLNLKLLNFD